ncbi:hypothetical protein HAX54_036268 [Datura stramonium]|uniref:Uncharacterized protein n=1 Tax=Datura stramonium TaxID=4076 RepID=A0ABS8VI26_DATST|nr:hypothetical protein [Datura stramonium]
MENYDIEIDENDEPRTTREIAKSRAMIPSTTLILGPQSEEGEDTQRSESRYGSKAPIMRALGNPKRSIREESYILVGSLNEVEDLKRLFNLYGFGWMERTPDRYIAETV